MARYKLHSGLPDLVCEPTSGQATSRRRSAGRVTALERRLARKLHAALGESAVAFVLWNGETIGTGTLARVRIGDRGALLRLVSDPNLYFGELYADGRIRVDGDLLDALKAVYRHMPWGEAAGAWSRWRERLHRLRSANTLSRSRENIHHHYDLGNEFYALWLDARAMQYTCAYYPRAGMSLEQAQLEKMHHVCRKLRLEPGETVIEVGCGWGGFARFMARHYGVRVRAYNISHQQIVHAREQAAREGLQDRVDFVEDDYRNIDGKCDAFVSVGMLEHVGLKHYGELGRLIERCLSDGGRGLVHTIGRDRPGSLNSWIEKRIFPGAFPPTLRQMMAIFEPWELSIQDVENLRLHYARTLEQWLERFEQHADRIAEMFDERFVRVWRLYLAGSAAGFSTGSLQLFQVLFTRSSSNDLPRSRAHLYLEQGPVGSWNDGEL